MHNYKFGKCIICHLSLENVFPEDYPEEWKFCCICLEIAKDIVSEDFEEGIWVEYVVEKIKRIITLVGR